MGTILIVDDEKSIRVTLKAFLELEGHRVEVAETASEAIEKLDATKFDIVLTDIILPKLSGVELLRTIKDLSPETMVMMMTGEPTLDTATESLRLGAVDYLQKPVSKVDVYKAVGNALRIKSFQDEKKRLEAENRRYMQDLEKMVAERTRELVEKEGILRTHAEELSILNKLARRVNSSITVEDTIRSGLKEMRRAAGSDFAVCFVLEGEKLLEKFIYPESAGEQWKPEAAHRIGHCLCGLCVSEKNAVFSENIHKDSRCSLDECKNAGFQSLAALPLKSGAEPLGVVALASRKQVDFSKRADFLESLANEISIGLKKSMLYEKLETQTVELRRRIQQIQETETERSQLQNQLQKAQKMEAIGTLAAGIAHDFNNILAAIMGYAELSMLSLPPDSRSAKTIKLSLSAAERAKDLIQQILAFSRQVEGERKPVAMAMITKEVLRFLRASLPSTIEINEYIDANLPNVLADPVHLHQIIMNLCTNAGHAMRNDGGRLRLCLEKANIDGNGVPDLPDLKVGEYVKLSVSDTGHGIQKEFLDRIFEPYFTTKEKGEGTGLGLAVTHGIVKKYQGAIRVESEPNKGAHFEVYIPAIGSEDKKIEKYEGTIEKGSEHILFVDDEPALVDISEQMLEQMGYMVSSRSSGRDALSLFEAQPDAFDLVITDLTMPYMTGDMLAEKIWEKRPGLPVILCTGFSESFGRKRQIKDSIKAVLMKPLNMLELSRTIRKVLDGG